MAGAGARGALGVTERRQWRDDFVASLLASWMVLGLVIDGWNHINLQDGRLGAFLTPWHGILYSGFTATACWILTRGQERGEWSLSRMPKGWNIALVGMGLATVGVAGDSVWHTLFGVEADVARMLAPFHLFLYIGVALVACTAARSAWLTLGDDPDPKQLVPALISIITVVVTAGFTVQYLSPFMTWFPPEMIRLVKARTFSQILEVLEVGGVVIWTVLLFGPVMVAARRWRMPTGMASMILLGSGGAIAALTQFSRGWSLLAIAAGGFVYEVLAARVPRRRVAAPAGVFVMWLCHYAVLASVYNVTFPIEIWLGAAGMGLLSAVAATVLVGRHPDSMTAPATADSDDMLDPVMATYLQHFSDVVTRMEGAHASLPLPPAIVEELFALVADAASVLTVGRMGVRVDESLRAVLFNLTARAEFLMRRHVHAQAFVGAPSAAAMASATLRHLERQNRLVIDLTDATLDDSGVEQTAGSLI